MPQNQFTNIQVFGQQNETIPSSSNLLSETITA